VEEVGDKRLLTVDGADDGREGALKGLRQHYSYQRRSKPRNSSVVPRTSLMRISESDRLSFLPPSRGFLKAETVFDRAIATAPFGAGVRLGPAPPEMNTAIRAGQQGVESKERDERNAHSAASSSLDFLRRAM
jgi:hypothetical protein